MPPLRALSLPPIATFSPSNTSSPAPEGSTPTPDDTPNDLAHLRALRLRRFAPAAPASVVAQPSTSASVAASVPAPALVVAPSVPAPALVVAPPPDSPAVAPLAIPHISAFFPSPTGTLSMPSTPRLLIFSISRCRGLFYKAWTAAGNSALVHSYSCPPASRCISTSVDFSSPCCKHLDSASSSTCSSRCHSYIYVLCSRLLG